MSASNGQSRPGRSKLLPAVRRTCRELDLTDEDAGTIRTAEVLARTIDEMDDATRERMLGQTVGQLTRVLDGLAERSRVRRAARPVEPARPDRWDELRARAAQRRQGLVDMQEHHRRLVDGEPSPGAG